MLAEPEVEWFIDLFTPSSVSVSAEAEAILHELQDEDLRSFHVRNRQHQQDANYRFEIGSSASDSANNSECSSRRPAAADPDSQGEFLDPLVVGRAFQGRINDPIGYVIAAHTLRRPYLGDIARLFDPIPVERPQDNASKVSMKITVQGDRVVAEDKNSSLASVVTVMVGGPGPAGAGVPPLSLTLAGPVITVGCVLMFGTPGVQNGVVEKIEAEDRIKLKFPVTIQEDKKTSSFNSYSLSSFKVAQAADSRAFLDACIDRLEKNRIVGIFPEGGSHDRTSLLELKPGVSLLALQASVELKKPIPVIPVGLNYFKGHQFRSRVFVDIEDPLYPSEQLTEENLLQFILEE
eukprot:g7214.t1